MGRDRKRKISELSWRQEGWVVAIPLEVVAGYLSEKWEVSCFWSSRLFLDSCERFICPRKKGDMPLAGHTTARKSINWTREEKHVIGTYQTEFLLFALKLKINLYETPQLATGQHNEERSARYNISYSLSLLLLSYKRRKRDRSCKLSFSFASNILKYAKDSTLLGS